MHSFGWQFFVIKLNLESRIPEIYWDHYVLLNYLFPHCTRKVVAEKTVHFVGKLQNELASHPRHPRVIRCRPLVYRPSMSKLIRYWVKIGLTFCNFAQVYLKFENLKTKSQMLLHSLISVANYILMWKMLSLKIGQLQIYDSDIIFRN